MFKVLIKMKEVGAYKTFPEAFVEFYRQVRQLSEGGTWQVLETMCFIVHSIQDIELPMSWYDARDFAYDVGLMKDNQLQDPLPEVPSERVELAFRNIYRTIFGLQ